MDGGRIYLGSPFEKIFAKGVRYFSVDVCDHPRASDVHGVILHPGGWPATRREHSSAPVRITHHRVARVWLRANIECVDTEYLWPRDMLATAFGNTVDEAGWRLLEYLDAPMPYSTCPNCCFPRCADDFEEHPRDGVLRCRFCKYERPLKDARRNSP